MALGLFVALDEASGYILGAIGPDVSNALGVSPSTFATLAAQRQTFVGLIALQFANVFYKRARRAQLSKQFGLQYGASFIIGSLVTWVPAMTAIVGASAAGAGVVYAAHRPLIMDYYPPAGRIRALCIHRGWGVLGVLAGTGLVAVLSSVAGLTWRGDLLVIGLVFLGIALLGLKLHEPGYGHFDTDRMAACIDRELAGSTLEQPNLVPIGAGDPTELGFWEAVRRVWLIPTVRRILVVWAVLGVAVTPLVTYEGFFLQEQFNFATNQRASFYAASWVLALPALLVAGRYGERVWREDANRLVKLCAGSMVLLALGLILAIIPVWGVSLTGFGIVFATESVSVAMLSFLLLVVVRPRSRPIAGALSAVFFGLVGGEGGSLALGSIASRFSAATAILVLAVPALFAAGALWRSAPRLMPDLDMAVEEVLEDEAVRFYHSQGRDFPLLACRGIDFSYGQLQVLYDVDFRVASGEMLALLGVNGAGKSSLLRVISGIALPSAGTVRLRGTDITFLDAERRVKMGITQVPGGRAVFAPLSVIDNLRGFAYSLGRSRRQTEACIEQCFTTFPVLADRRNQVASTLSGGEQQMLGLSKALLLRPQLLLIDELSLGLAPIVIEQLLEMVRTINQRGTSVVLVEQSISLALDFVDHAYFMEKGQVRFDGPAHELRRRDDLLRAVFLGSATDRQPP